MNTVYIILGGNIGNRSENLLQARQFIEEEAGKIGSASGIFVTAAWGHTSQPDFYNQALCIGTMLPPQQLLNTLLDIEKKMGRIRAGKTYISRIIDIDILFYGNKIINEKNLVIPHPLLHLRKFVLEPLVAVAPEFVHPVTGKTIVALLAEVVDTCQVQVAVGKDEFERLLNS